MTNLDPRTPVIVGVGQINNREHGAEPVDLMSRSAEAALADSGAELLDRIGDVRVVWGVWPYKDPGRLVAERLGVPDARTTMTASGGNQVYDLVIDTARRIQAGELGATIVCGAETLRTRRKDRAEGRRSSYLDEAPDASPDEMLSPEKDVTTELENEVGIWTAANFYALAETALRHRLGESVDDHRSRVAGLWAEASRVAAANPGAWTRTEYSPAEIATESPSNRPVAAPYPKLMTSNLNVDQSAAVVVCSVAEAEEAGVPRDRWVFPLSGSNGADHDYPTTRWALDESPAMRLVGERTLELAGVTVDDCELIDLYSCFPVAVQVAQREGNIDPARPFTITGGLTFAAGPLNCYCLLPLVRAVRLLRERPARRAFLTGNGGYFSKHSALVLSGNSNGDGFRYASVQAEVDAQPSRPIPAAPADHMTLEAYTVTFGRDGAPERAIIAGLADDGTRHWGNLTDAETMRELLATDACGREVTLDGTTARLV